MARNFMLAVILLCAVVAAAEVPVANAELGHCAAHFHVADASGQPVKNASVHVSIDRNLISLPSFFTFRVPWRSREVKVLTNENGEAVVSGLPEKIKKQLVFDVSKSRFMSLIVFAPETDSCHPDFEVKFE